MGRAVADQLRAAGHTVIGVDLDDADVTTDLSAPRARREAAAAVLSAAGERLDGAVLAAGLGPVRGRERAIAQVNYFGVVDLLRAWRPALAAAGNAKVVVFSSNSTTTTPGVPRRFVRALLAEDADRALRGVRLFGKAAAPIVYGGSKLALSRWVRRNALAPGAVLTPLLEDQLASPAATAVASFPVPVGGYGDPSRLADWAVFMLSDAADFLCGSVIFVDGGSDAYFRADAWPQSLRLPALVRYLRRLRSFARR
jgi:NAD(P)-dependent dehydrogenase (short-subunit alcohol dehydrogenase family)